MTRVHSSGANGRIWENIAEWSPWVTLSVVTPKRSRASPSTALPDSTPMEPVTVPGSATITSDAIAM